MEVIDPNVLKGHTTMQPLYPAAITLPFLFILGGVQVGVSTNGPRPAEPTPEAYADGYVWPSNRIYPLLPLRMNDGSTWKVKMIRTAEDGTLMVELRRATSTTTASRIEVQPTDVDTPIWWSTLEYVPDPEEPPVVTTPGTPGESEPVPTSPVPTPTPTPTPDPQDPPTPPEGQ